jgi:CubicO group peptidase (beta-lactamase class C family)
VPLPVTPLPPALADAKPQLRGYALGWIVQDYRGHKVVQHAGGTQGFRAIVVLIPEKNVGFAIANNSEDNEFVPGVQYALLDHYLGLPKHDWPRAFKDLFEARNAAGKPARITMKAYPPVADFSFDYHDLEFTPVAAQPAAGR